MLLARVQLGLFAAIAAACAVSIFAGQVLLALAAAVFLVRLARGQAPPPRLPEIAIADYARVMMEYLREG